MKTLLIIMTIFISSWGYGYNHKNTIKKSHKIKCKYDFNTKEIVVEGFDDSGLKRTFEGSELFIKDINNLSPVSDYLTKTDENGQYKMTYSLTCVKEKN